MASILRGLDMLLAKANTLKYNTSKKAGRAGLNAALTVFVRATRQAINGSSASAEEKSAARKTIGKRLLKAKQAKELLSGKVGFGVGKPSGMKRQKAFSRAGDKFHRGVGISYNNIHWLVLGTKDRTAGLQRDSLGKLRRDNSRHGSRSGAHAHYTGKMPATLLGVVETAVSSAIPAAFEAMRQKVEQVLAAEAAKH